jgi:hypothetical protein
MSTLTEHEVVFPAVCFTWQCVRRNFFVLSNFALNILFSFPFMEFTKGQLYSVLFYHSTISIYMKQKPNN